MRIVFGVLSLLVVVAIIGILAKKQLGAVTGAPAALPGVSAPAGAQATPQQQVQQYQKALEGALQQARPMPEEK